MDDTFNTISGTSEGLYKEKGSRFIGYAFHVGNEEEIREILKKLKKEHHAARHHCYAWKLGAEGVQFRANDDGEPSSTAGKPILGAITAAGLTNVLVVVVRYFGGILLGTNGLIVAYRTAATEALKNAVIVTCKIETRFILTFGYSLMNEVMKLIKTNNLEASNMTMGDSCSLVITCLKSDKDRITTLLSGINNLKFSLFT